MAVKKTSQIQKLWPPTSSSILVLPCKILSQPTSIERDGRQSMVSSDYNSNTTNSNRISPIFTISTAYMVNLADGHP